MSVKIDIEAAELNVVYVPDVASDGSQTRSDGYATELQRNDLCNRHSTSKRPKHWAK
jgi:hypothetical protein